MNRLLLAAIASLLFVSAAGCGSGSGSRTLDLGEPIDVSFVPLMPASAPPAGNPSGAAVLYEALSPEDTSAPDRVVGDGSPASCTAQAFVDAVALGGVITFACGPEPVTITLTEPARVFNDTAMEGIVIDGGGLVTLSGGADTRRHLRG